MRLLAVHAHPDDETLATGVLLATCALAGWGVGVLTCTRGERGEVIPSDLRGLQGDDEALAAVREVELRRALAALGVGWHRFLDAGLPARVTDSGMAWVRPGLAGPAPDSGPAAFARLPLDAAADALAQVFREFAPDVVVTYEPGGNYGHPDHIRTHEVTMAALSRVAVPLVLWTSTPADVLVDARAALPPDAQFAMPVEELPSLADDHGLPRLTVEAPPVADRVVAAMAAHRTQIQAAEVLGGPQDSPLAGRYALSNDVWAPILDEGYVVAGGDGDVPWPDGVRVTP